MYLLALLVISISTISVQSMPRLSDRPHYVECVNSYECPFDGCCVLGMGRFSVPQCQRKLQANENCRPDSDIPINSTVAYLDGSVVSLHNVHLIMCPCSEGLTCDRHLGKCVDFNSLTDTNAIDQYETED